VEYSDDNSCFDDHDVQDESQAELFLDIIGDDEPVKMEESEIREAPCSPRQVFIENKPICQSPITTTGKESYDIKCEEFDVDEFLSNETNDIICPSSPDSEPVSPASATIIEIDSSFQSDHAKTESGMVGETTTDGYRVMTGDFIDDEFLLSSCATNDLNNACNITDVDDPFSELFPSLLSV
jgi:hypothetical protein